MSRKFWSGALHIYLPSLLMMIGQGMLIPALPVLGVFIAFNFLGDALRDAADPYS